MIQLRVGIESTLARAGWTAMEYPQKRTLRLRANLPCNQVRGSYSSYQTEGYLELSTEQMETNCNSFSALTSSREVSHRYRNGKQDPTQYNERGGVFIGNIARSCLTRMLTVVRIISRRQMKGFREICFLQPVSGAQAPRDPRTSEVAPA